jgi:hypothetical protein
MVEFKSEEHKTAKVDDFYVDGSVSSHERNRSAEFQTEEASSIFQTNLHAYHLDLEGPSAVRLLEHCNCIMSTSPLSASSWLPTRVKL